ncbi:MAG: hypothetical protein KAX49_03685 [Halanaerobiales bacterium]|nr:hypothetical protein [Halanaerobiales bacterium]
MKKNEEKEEIDIAKYNISKLQHTIPRSSNENVVLKNLGLSSFSRIEAMDILLEILNVKIMVLEKEK